MKGLSHDLIILDEEIDRHNTRTLGFRDDSVILISVLLDLR